MPILIGSQPPLGHRGFISRISKPGRGMGADTYRTLVSLPDASCAVLCYRVLYWCPCCGHYVNAVQTDEDAAVCDVDGFVLDGGPVFYRVPMAPKALGKGTYRRIFHFNERMALFMLEDPPIPDKLYELIEDEAWTGYMEGRYPHPDDMWFKDISKVCASVRVPKWAQEHYRSRKFKMNPLTSLAKFKEKWLTIKFRLSGVRPVPEEAREAVEPLKDYFRALQAPWDYLTKRRNFINYNLVINIGLERLGMQRYKVFFPMVRGKKKLRELCAMMMAMFRYLNWEPTGTLSKYAGPRQPGRRRAPLGLLGNLSKSRGTRTRQVGRSCRTVRRIGGMPPETSVLPVPGFPPARRSALATQGHRKAPFGGTSCRSSFPPKIPLWSGRQSVPICP